jgi:anaerobic glycerol-3-phosphate dehydrogenase
MSALPPKADSNFDRGITNLCQFTRSVPISMQMDADVPSLDQLRSNAAECIRLAEAARTSEHKSLFIEMAETWLTLAEHAAREGRLNGGSLFRDR